MKKKILIIAGGGARHLEPFLEAGKRLGVPVRTASFSQLSCSFSDGFVVRVADLDIASFNVVYIRLVGRRLEDATLLANYAKRHGVRLVDRVYEDSLLMPLTLAKSVETQRLLAAGIPMPLTFFAKLSVIREKGEELLGFPFVIKSTSGKQGKEVWLPKTREELIKLIGELGELEKKGKRFLAQKFIRASQRNRLFVVGERIIAGITRPTKWRKRFIEKVNGEYPEGKKELLVPLPTDDVELALKAAKAVSLEIAGVDIIYEDKTGEAYVLEVNSAPRWEAVSKNAGISVEEEIVKYLASL